MGEHPLDQLSSGVLTGGSAPRCRYPLPQQAPVWGVASPSEGASSKSGVSLVDLFTSETTTQCPLWFSLAERTSTLGQDALAHDWPGSLPQLSAAVGQATGGSEPSLSGCIQAVRVTKSAFQPLVF